MHDNEYIPLSPIRLRKCMAMSVEEFPLLLRVLFLGMFHRLDRRNDLDLSGQMDP